jgi:general secretion pathway protein G
MKSSKLKNQNGYSLLELVITMSILAILVVGTIPLAQNAVKRRKEAELRDALRVMRLAIDEFKRDTYGACPQGSQNSTNPIPGANNALAPPDPRSRVVIDDCKIFTTENVDRYPPSLKALADGVKVKSRMPANLQGGRPFDDKNATEINETKEITKVYLREIPKDPFTDSDETWELRSNYQAKDAENWDEINVFDVRSGYDEESLSGDKYSEW